MKKILSFLFLVPVLSFAQQIADPDFRYKKADPQYPRGEGPVVLIDEAHHNFHTREGRYAPFASVLEEDGFQVLSLTEPIDQKALENARILVISNPIHRSNLDHWALPTHSAFTPEEIEVMEHWVKAGGRLFLIADHMPFSGAATALAAAFGFEFNNGFAKNPEKQGWDLFRKDDHTLIRHPLTEGISQVATFTGQAFQIPEKATGLLKFSRGYISLMPDTAWQFSDQTRRVEVEGWYQGAIMKYGRGKLAVFGEAAMFTTQLAGPRQLKIGMNAKGAEQNVLLLLKVIAWLDDR